MTIYMGLASLFWLALLIGLLFRKHRCLHVSLMLTGIFGDVFLVLYLQIARDALQIAISFSLGILPQLHIISSSIALLLYFPVVVLGSQLVNGELRYRKWHIRLAISAFVFRSIGFFLMFTMIPDR